MTGVCQYCGSKIEFGFIETIEYKESPEKARASRDLTISCPICKSTITHQGLGRD
jgi:DNA-directed RNA polymerase subunit RPC12/RpoP